MDNIPNISNVNDTYQNALEELNAKQTEQELSLWRTKYLGGKAL